VTYHTQAAYIIDSVTMDKISDLSFHFFLNKVKQMCSSYVQYYEKDFQFFREKDLRNTIKAQLSPTTKCYDRNVLDLIFIIDKCGRGNRHFLLTPPPML
jgi:hypothetical protein